MPKPEAQKTEELLRGLWCLLGLVILCLIVIANDFLTKFPVIQSPKTKRRLRKVRSPAPRLRRCTFPWSRVRSPALPSASALAPAPAPTIAPLSPAAVPSPLSLPSALTSPAPLTFLPPASPPPLALSPPFSPPPAHSGQASPPLPTSPASSASPQVQSPAPPSSPSESSSSTEKSRRPPIIERLRQDIERREYQDRIRELEQTIKALNLQMANMQRCSNATALNPSAPSFSPSHSSQPPPMQPVVSAGAASPPPPPPPPPQPLNIQYPRPPHIYTPPHGFRQPPPTQQSLDDFFKRFPKTGRKEPGWGRN